MRDTVHYKVIFEVREKYNMTQDLAQVGWAKFGNFNRLSARTYEVSGTRCLDPNLWQFPEVLMHYVQSVFSEIKIDILEFSMKVEID
jgi:hypothetical protein